MDEHLKQRIGAAIWAGDIETLDKLAPCGCCCSEHTDLDCPARYWNGCRSGLGPGEQPYDGEAWAEHYAKLHGMSEAEFYDWEVLDE